MAERVDIMVVAQDNASQALRGITSSFGALGNMVSTLTSGRAIEALTEQIISFGKEGVDATVKYANEVRSLQMVSGASAEETSRFLQVLDDYKISAQDAMAATRAMTKEGLVPNLETLANLSEEYLKINDKQKQNEFIIKNLGRAGLQWVEVLGRGKDAILAQGEAVSESLILTQEAVDQAREYELALDDWNDAVLGLKISIGTQLLPALTEMLDTVDLNRRAAEIMGGTISRADTFTQEYADAIEQAKQELRDQRLATDEVNQSTNEYVITEKEAKEAAQKAEQAIKELTKANEDYLSMVGNLADNLTSYEQKHDSIQRELDEGNITLEEASQQWQELAATQEQATRRMILNMLQEQLAMGGLNQAETGYLLDLGLKWGVYSQSAVDATRAAQIEVQQLTNQFNGLPTSHTFTTYFQTVGALPGFNPQAAPGGYGYNRAGGGNVSAGTMYRVNETRTEYFQPSMNGTVLPLGNGGAGGSGVVINYSPMVSLGNQREVESVLLPMVEQAVRKMQSDGRAAL